MSSEVNIHEDFLPLSAAMEDLAGFVHDIPNDTFGVMTVETMVVGLLLECQVHMDEGDTPMIRVAPPRRTLTSVEPVMHAFKITVEADG